MIEIPKDIQKLIDAQKNGEYIQIIGYHENRWFDLMNGKGWWDIEDHWNKYWKMTPKYRIKPRDNK